jgi:di-N-acetylchitobiase
MPLLQAQLPNATARNIWVSQQVAIMQQNFTDGINIDIEQNTANSASLTILTQNVASALRAVKSYAQISFDTAIYPNNAVQGYNFTALAEACDFLVPMAYDMCWGAAKASANSPLNGVQAGLQQYFNDFNVGPEKIVVGLPWYGYDFPCTNTLPTPNASCTSESGFSGGWSRTFAQVVEEYPNATIFYQPGTMSPYLSYFSESDSQWHQIWFDDEISLGYKYQAAADLKLRGVAMWTANFLPYPNNSRVASMWDTLAKYYLPSN